MGVKDRPQCYFDVELNREPVGRIVFQLFSDVCPKTSKNFLCLCTGEKGTGKLTGKKLCFKGSTFHRVVKNFMVQGGDFTEGNGRGGESIYGGYFEDENFLLKHDKAYLLSMANRGKDTNGSQFFITTKVAPHLDGVHVVFGSIISGFEVIKKVEGLKTDSSSRPYADVRVMDCGQLFTKSANDVLEGKRKRSSHSANSSFSSHDSSSQYSSSENESDEKHKHHKHKRHAKSKRSKRRRRESKKMESVDVLPSNQSSPSPVEEEVLEVEVEVEVEQSGRREKLTVRPEEIPPVPENRFLLRRDVPPQEVKAEIVETEETCPLTDPKPSVSKSGRKIKGRGTMRYHTPTRSKSRSASVEERGSSETPPHWKEEMKRTKVYQPPSIERWSKGDKLNDHSSSRWENRSDSAWSREEVQEIPVVFKPADSSTQRKLRSSLSFRDSRSYSRSSYSQSRSRGRKRKGSKPKAAAMMPEKLPDSKAPPLPRLPSVPASESTPVIPMSDSPPPSRWKPGQKPWKPSYVQEVKAKAALGSSSGPTVASVTEKAQTAVTPKCLLVDSEIHKRSRSYSRSRSRSYSRSSSYSRSDSETSIKAPSNKRNSLDKEWKEYYSSLKRVNNVDKYISLASSQDAKSGSNSPDVSKRSQDQEGKQFSSMPAESFNSRSEWDSDTERESNSGARNLAISEKEEGEASSESEFETSRKASEEVSAPKITKAAAKGPEEVAEKHKSKKKSKQEKIRVQQRAKECINKNSKHTESLLQPSNRNGADVPIVKQQESLEDMDICTPEHDAEIAFERNVSTTEHPHGARQRSELPGGPEGLGAGSEDGDKESEPGATGVSVRRGPEDRSAQPEAEERGELQRGEVSVRGDNTIPQEVSLQRLVPVLQPVQERSRSSSYSSRSRSRSRRRRRGGRSRSRSTTYRRSHSRTYSRSRSRSRSRHRRRRSRSDSYDSYSSRSRSASSRRGRRRSRSSRSSERRSRSSRSSSRSSSSSRYS
ncbi:NK-tumor recognition protein [Dissostichus eleginoides]|uniref:peptidylprolyl isomerase n=1 Tax=Dissostichus eleginoides TaxID=100907 RepID=A0AAD9BLB8_DISEL|nr:NK-tumor recognition protein [Dissostichus eleginoides]